VSRRRGRMLPVRVFTVACALVACGRDAAPRCDPIVPGVPVASNSAVPAEPEAVRFTELWRVGGLVETQAFGEPVAPALGPDRRIAVPDFQLAEVLLIGADGEWLGPVAKPGPGPGELDTPVAATWSVDGRLHVFDLGKPAVITFDAAGAFLHETPVDPAFTAPIVMRGELSWAGITAAGHLLVQLGVEAKGTDPSRGSESLLLLRAGSTAIDTLLAVEMPLVWGARFQQWPVPGWPRIAVAIGPGGTIALGGTGGDRFVVLDAGARPALQVCTGAAPQPLTPAERGVESPESLRDLADAIAIAPRPESPAAFGRLVLAGDGSIWVQRERRPAFPDFAGSMYGAPGATYDVFGRDGAYRTTLRMPDAARLQAVAGDTLWAYEVGSLDQVSLVAYRLER